MNAMEAKQPAKRNLDWRLLLCIGRMVLHLLAGMATCAFVFPFIGPVKRNALVRRWSGQK